MSIQVKLIGVNHKIQHNHPEAQTEEKLRTIRDFSAYINDVVRTYSISLLAEEFNREYCEANRVVFSTIQVVSDELNVTHLFCEPSSAEKESRGIRKTDPDYHDKRELFWREKLLENTKLCKHVAFFCGSLHLGSFKAKLEGSGVKAIILSEGWGDNLPDFIPPF